MPSREKPVAEEVARRSQVLRPGSAGLVRQTRAPGAEMLPGACVPKHTATPISQGTHEGAADALRAPTSDKT